MKHIVITAIYSDKILASPVIGSSLHDCTKEAQEEANGYDLPVVFEQNGMQYIVQPIMSKPLFPSMQKSTEDLVAETEKRVAREIRDIIKDNSFKIDNLSPSVCVVRTDIIMSIIEEKYKL